MFVINSVVSIISCLVLSTSVHGEKVCPFSNFAEEMEKLNTKPIMDPLSASQSSTLVAVNMVYRHGARSEHHEIPEHIDTYTYVTITGTTLGAGDLLKEGQAQAEQLGEYLKNRYFAGIFYKYRYSYEEIVVKVSDVKRAIFTAQFCLSKLFPHEPYSSEIITLNLYDPKNGKTVPVDSFPIPMQMLEEEKDNKIQMRKPCTKLMALHDAFIRVDSPEVKPVYDGSSKVFADLKVPVGQYEKVYQMADTNWVKCQNKKEWTMDENIFPTLTPPLHNLQFTTWTGNVDLQRLDVGPLITELTDNFKVKIGMEPVCKDNWSTGAYPKAKMYMYSGHDPTVAAILNTFNMFKQLTDKGIPIPPLYTATILFELHKSKKPEPVLESSKDVKQDDVVIPSEKPKVDESEDFVVKLFYKYRKDEPILEMTFDKCPAPCTFSNFLKVYNHLIIASTEWSRLCGGR